MTTVPTPAPARPGYRPAIAFSLALLTPFPLDAQPAGAARPVKLTNIETSYPHWSPDGRRIVYQSNRTGNSEIYVMNADGTGAVRLTDHPAADENPAWSPDGRRIAFRSYRDGNAEIYTMAPDGSDLRNLTNHPADDIHPYWSADGSRLLFNSTRERDPAGRPVLTVFSMRADGSDVRRISRDVIEETYAQYSPDGAGIVFRRLLPENTPGWDRNPGNSDIFVMNADGGDARRLTTHPGFDGWPSWSPDGAWITFAGEGSGQFQIQVIRPDGTDLRRLTDGPGSFTKPIFSPDGRRIVCTRTLDGNVEIFVLEVDLGGQGPVAADGATTLLAGAARAMGGEPLLRALPPLSTSYHLIERSLGQEEWVDGPAASSLQLGDRTGDAAGQRERLTMQRYMSGGRRYDRTVDAGRWSRLTGERPRGGSAGIELSLSAALAALHPEALLPRLIADPAANPTRARSLRVAGRPTTPVLARLGEVPVTIFVDESDSALVGVEWNDRLLAPDGTGNVRAIFSQYRAAVAVPGAPRLPHLVEVWRGEALWQVRTYAEYRVGGTLDGAVAGPVATAVVEQAELGAGVLHLRGGDYHSLLVDVGDRVILTEVPESLERGRAVVEVARQRAGGRPITVVMTHLHEDHIAGLDAVADLEILAHPDIVEPLRARLRAGGRGAAARVTPVSERMRLGAGESAVELLTLPHSHGGGMLVVYIPAIGLLFETDLIRGLLPHSTDELVQWVRTTGLPVRQVASSHGPPQAWGAVERVARRWRESLGTAAPGA